MGIANRTDFDLKTHSKKPEDAEGKRKNPDSTEDLSYFDPQTNERFYPYCIEPSAGVNRTLLAVLMDAYTEKTNDKGEKRVILKLKKDLAPIKVAVLPLAKNKPEIVAMAKDLKRQLLPQCEPSMTTPAASENSTQDKTKSARRSALRLTTNLWKTTPLRCAIEILGSKSVLKSKS